MVGLFVIYKRNYYIVVMAAKPLDYEQLKDAERLRKIFELRKREDPSWSQEKLAHACGWKTQGSVNQYLHGKIPLNLPALKKFAEALKFSIEEISPSLFNQAYSLSKLVSPDYKQLEKITPPRHNHIQSIIALMEETDDEGKAMILQAAKIASHTRKVQLFELEKMKSTINNFAKIGALPNVDDQQEKKQQESVLPTQRVSQ